MIDFYDKDLDVMRVRNGGATVWEKMHVAWLRKLEDGPCPPRWNREIMRMESLHERSACMDSA